MVKKHLSIEERQMVLDKYQIKSKLDVAKEVNCHPNSFLIF